MKSLNILLIIYFVKLCFRIVQYVLILEESICKRCLFVNTEQRIDNHLVKKTIQVPTRGK